YKAGRTQQSSNLSKSHTGFLSESYNLSLSVFKQAGITAVDSLEGLVASSKILSRYKKVKGNRIMVITNGAGAVIQAMDIIEQNKKIKLGKMQKSFKKSLSVKLPGYALIENIIDLTGSSSDSDYKTAINDCYNNKDIDIIMVWIMLQNPFISEDFYRIFGDYIKENKKPLIVGAAGEEYTRKVGARIESLGIPVFYTVDDWVAAAEAISK
ncbi:MAG: acetate--CoA ligase family protein, partial [Actinobacteria bacterium]|nr:acetate--CoA ligase family protein [Actinomycetota bacterium]